MMKDFPVLYNKKENCCGCTACYAVCPVKAITMKKDSEGFLYPIIDNVECIKCNKCLKACAFKADQKNKGFSNDEAIAKASNMNNEPAVFAVKHKNIRTRMSSRSGGIFTAISDYFLENSGIVYGCVLTSDFRAVHARANSKEKRDRMCGSKYIQSEMKNIFKSVQKDLKAGKKVLFSGTSCQVAGLKSFLGIDYDNLFCVDIVCHGVPSPLVWEKYLEWQEKKNHGKCVSVDFRNKKDFGWTAHVETLIIKKKSGKIKKSDSEIFKKLFLSDSISRYSCYKCPYKSTMHPGDITIADYWGIEKAAPGFDDNKGVSLVLVNNSKGTDIFKKISDSIIYKKTDINDSMQPALEKPFTKPKNRAEFWKDFENKDFDYISRKYADYTLLRKIKKKIKYLAIRLHKI